MFLIFLVVRNQSLAYFFIQKRQISFLKIKNAQNVICDISKNNYFIKAAGLTSSEI